MHHVLCTTCVLSRRGAAAAAAGIETSGPSSQLGGETLYWSFGKMGAPLYRQTGHSPLCSKHMRSPVHAASWQAAHVDPRLGQDVGSQGEGTMHCKDAAARPPRGRRPSLVRAARSLQLAARS